MPYVKTDKCLSKERIHPKTELRFFGDSEQQQQQQDFLTLKKNQTLILILGGFSHKSSLHVSCHASKSQNSAIYDNCMNFLNHHYIIDISLWDARLSPKCKFLHFNASQWDSSWGMDLAEQDFDIVCKKFMTACLTQCPVPEVIYLLQTFSILWPCLKFYRVTSAAVWL